MPPCPDTSSKEGEPENALEFDLAPASTTSAYNSTYPRDRNNGALWAGRGVSSQVAVGGRLRYRSISAAALPLLAYQQNREFTTPPVELPGYSPFIYSGHPAKIDWPHRFGSDAFWLVDPGQSYLRVDAFGGAAGISTENLWWGPALRNPLLMSNTAPGFPHLFLGTSRPLNIGIGHLEIELVWGRLDESDYFDSDASNDDRLFSGIVLDYQPRWLPGLFLGAARVYHSAFPSTAIDVLLKPYRDVRGNIGVGPLTNNQLISVFGRWALPDVGFETYAEWAREDHWLDLEDLLGEPDHSQAYMLGFQKILGLERRWVRVYGELTHLENSITSVRSRGGTEVTFYTHGRIRQGHTHKGQLLGAGIGPGSDAQVLGFDVLHERGRYGFFLERTRYDDDAYGKTWARFYGLHGHDVEISAGSTAAHSWGPVDLNAGAIFSRRRNRNFLGLQPTPDFEHFRVDYNLSLALGITVRHWPRAAP